jgi:hypothetical protein
MHNIKKGKKILHSWFMYQVINKKGKIVDEIIGNEILRLLFEGSQYPLIDPSTPAAFSNKLFAMRILKCDESKIKNLQNNSLGLFSSSKMNYINTEYEHEIIVNEKNQILFEGVIKIHKVGNGYPFLILELDPKHKKWKKYSNKKNMVYCIINNLGEIVSEPTTKKIQYIPFINSLVIGDQDFKLHKNSEEFDSIVEVIPQNTYLVSRGKRKGLMFGQAFWDESSEYWDQYACGPHWLPSDTETVDFYETHAFDFYIVKINQTYKFYRAQRRSTGMQNRFIGNEYVKIIKIFNVELFHHFGFFGINQNNSIDYIQDENNVIELEFTDIDKALDYIITNLKLTTLTYSNMSDVYPDTSITWKFRQEKIKK